MSEEVIIGIILLMMIFFIVVQRILNKQENSTISKKNLSPDMKTNFTITNNGSRVYSLQLTNTIIYVLSIFGSIGFIVFGWKRGECINNCGSWDAEYIADPFMIIVGVAALLTSTLIFQVINVFALFVENSISK